MKALQKMIKRQQEIEKSKKSINENIKKARNSKID